MNSQRVWLKLIVGDWASDAAWSNCCLRPYFLKLLYAALFDLIFVKDPFSLHLKVRCLEPLLEFLPLQVVKVALSCTADLLCRAKVVFLRGLNCCSSSVWILILSCLDEIFLVIRVTNFWEMAVRHKLIFHEFVFWLVALLFIFLVTHDARSR